MTVRPRLDLRQQARLSLSPHMRQSLAVLRMPATDLADMLALAAAENPFLVCSERRAAGGGAAYDLALATVAARPGFMEELVHQLRARSLDPGVRAVAEYLAGELREDGYLDADPADLADLGLPAGQFEAGLAALQACEPAGIGARTLAECLELQLADRGLGRPLAQGVVAALDDIAAGRLAAVAKRLGLTEAEMRRVAGLVRGLTPHPVAREEEMQAVLRPDIRVSRGADGVPVVSLSGDVPSLRLDRRLAATAGADFAARRCAEAEGLIRAVRQRGETLLAIGRAIVAHQEAFFTEGPDRLRPLLRADLAGTLGLHPSTLGRAVAAKGLEAEGRIYPLAFFFSLPAPGAEGVSAFVLSRTIARMIAEEPSGAPLSDAEIAGRLSRDGVDIARRTVAKYRDGMKIPSSRRRRRPDGPLADEGARPGERLACGPPET